MSIYQPGTTINRPVEFSGTAEERRANRDSHFFYYTGGPDDADVRCDRCDCRPSHEAANYPCGTDVPRENFVVG